MLTQEFSSIRMNQKETISDSDHRFLTLLNKLLVALQHAHEILCGFYLLALPIFVAVFVMNKHLHTLDENFGVVEKFEQGMVSLGKNISGDNSKPQKNKNVS